jgi:hypothetical protein
MNTRKISPEEAIRRVVDKRLQRGATVENVRAWLEHCRDEVWRTGPAHEAVKKQLRALPARMDERDALTALVGLELDNYADGRVIAQRDGELDNYRVSSVNRLRTILGVK